MQGAGTVDTLPAIRFHGRQFLKPLLKPESALVHTALDLLAQHRSDRGAGDSAVCGKCGLPFPCPTVDHARQVVSAGGLPSIADHRVPDSVVESVFVSPVDNSSVDSTSAATSVDGVSEGAAVDEKPDAAPEGAVVNDSSDGAAVNHSSDGAAVNHSSDGAAVTDQSDENPVDGGSDDAPAERIPVIVTQRTSDTAVEQGGQGPQGEQDGQAKHGEQSERDERVTPRDPVGAG